MDDKPDSSFQQTGALPGRVDSASPSPFVQIPTPTNRMPPYDRKPRWGRRVIWTVIMIGLLSSIGLLSYTSLQLNSQVHLQASAVQHGYTTQTALVQHESASVQTGDVTQTALAQNLQNLQGSLTAQATGTVGILQSGTPGATFITQSNNKITVRVGATFTIFFTLQNTGTSTWSDLDGYTLSCTASPQRAFSSCLGGGEPKNQLHLGSYLVAPGNSFTFGIHCSADPTYLSEGAGYQYFTFWKLTHKGTPFGPEMEFIVNVIA